MRSKLRLTTTLVTALLNFVHQAILLNLCVPTLSTNITAHGLVHTNHIKIIGVKAGSKDKEPFQRPLRRTCVLPPTPSHLWADRALCPPSLSVPSVHSRQTCSLSSHFLCPLCTVIWLEIVSTWCRSLADAVLRHDGQEFHLAMLLSHLHLVSVLVSISSLALTHHFQVPDSLFAV